MGSVSLNSRKDRYELIESAIDLRLYIYGLLAVVAVFLVSYARGYSMRLLSKSSVFTLSAMLLVLFAVITVTLAQTAARDEPEQLLKSDSFESSPEIVSAPVTTGYSELEYRYAVEISNVDGFPVEFALDVAPGGMTIDPQTGLIEWPTPQIGLHDVTVLVWDARAHFDEQPYTLEIIEGFGEPQIVSAAPLSVELNAVYDYQPEVLNPQGLPLHYDLLMAPPGMTIDAQSGRIRWLAQTEGVSDVMWSVSDTADNTDTQAFELTVLPRTGEFEVGGQLLGLDQGVLFLHETISGQRLRLTANGPFGFPLEDGSNYSIEIDEQSDVNGLCIVMDAAGQVEGRDIADAIVQCVQAAADPEALIDEAEALADSGTTITTEAFEQTDFGRNQLPELESAKIDRNHALVLAAVDPDPEWISTRFDSDRVIVTDAGRQHTINAVKLDIDFNEIGPVDSNRLKFNIRIQREDHRFEWLPREFATEIVQWTDVPGQFVVQVPADLTRGRLVIGIRPDFEDVGQVAIAERWSEALLFEVWPVRAGVLEIDPADVRFPVDFQQPLSAASLFSLEEIESATATAMTDGEILLPLVLETGTPLAVDDLIEYRVGEEPYSGRVASIQNRGGQQFVQLHPDWQDVYDIADADDTFLTDQGVLPEIVAYRIGDRVPGHDAPYRDGLTSLDHDAATPRIVQPPERTSSSGRIGDPTGYFSRNCASGSVNTALAISPKFSLYPAELSVNVSVATTDWLKLIDCTWDANPNKRFPNVLRAAGPIAIIAEKLLGTEVAPRPIGRLIYRTEGDVGGIEALKMSFSTKRGVKTDFPSNPRDFIDFHSLEGNPLTVGTRIGGNVGVALVANIFGNRGLLGRLANFFVEDIVELGIEASVTTGAGILVSGANAPAVYRGLGTTKAGFEFNFCAKLEFSRAMANLFRRLVSLDPTLELFCLRDSIPIGDPTSQFNAEKVKDDLQGNARIQELTALPALAAFHGINVSGRLAPPNGNRSSVFNDVHHAIKYDLEECENNANGEIRSPVIACAGLFCGKTPPVKLCGTKLWVDPLYGEALTGAVAEAEGGYGVRSSRTIPESMNVRFEGSPLTTQHTFDVLTKSRPSRTIQASAQCGPTSSIEVGEITVTSVGFSESLTASNRNIQLCRCKPTDPDCDRIWGSPHLISADGLALDYYASGDYILSKLPGVEGLQVQGRFLPGMDVSWPQAVAMQVGADIVEIHSERWTPEPPRPQLISHRLRVWVNGIEIIQPGEWASVWNWRLLDLPGGGLLYVNSIVSRFLGDVVDPLEITVVWPQEDVYANYGVSVKALGTNSLEERELLFGDPLPIVEISLIRPDALAGLETGMLGNNDGDPLNDMQLRNGTQIEFSENLSWTELYALFGADWLVRSNECLFRNGCIDPQFPLSPAPLDPDMRQFAEAACFGLQGWYRQACIHDVALSGSTEMVEGLYENTQELNAMADRLVLPGVDIPLFQLQPGAVEKVGFKELYHFSVELLEGQGEYVLSLIPPRGTSAVLASTGQGSLVDTQPRADTVELTCIPDADWQEQLSSAWPAQGSLQLWAIDPLSGSPRTLLGEMILPAERIGEFCTDLRDEVDSTFMQDAELKLQNVGPDTLTVRIQPAEAIELAPEALDDLTLCAGCDLNLNLAHQCTGGIQKLGDLHIFGSDGVFQESRPMICKTIASTVSPLLDEALFIDEEGHLWDLHSEREFFNNSHADLFWSDRPVPIHIDTFDPIELVQVVSGGSGVGLPNALALDAEGQVWSWGYNNVGQLGFASCIGGDPEPCIDESEEPLLIPPAYFSAPIVQIAGNGQLNFALDADGQVWSWGANFRGGLGNAGDARSRSRPERIQFGASPGLRINTIAAGSGYALALDETGQLWAWGRNTNGQLGLGNVAFGPTPEPVALDMSAFAGAELLMISANGEHVLVLDERGRLWGWGSNQNGQLSGELPLTNLPWPRLLSAHEFADVQFEWIISSAFSTLAKDTDQQLWSWGANYLGQLGVGDFEPREGPVQVDLSMLGDASIRFAEKTVSSVGLVYDTAGRFWTWGSSIMMPNGYGHEPRPVLLADRPGAELQTEIESFVGAARLTSGSTAKEAIAVADIRHWARDAAPFRSLRLTDPRLSFADTGLNTLEVPRLRPMRVAIMSSGAELCERPGYYPLEIELVGENDQVLAESSISLECAYPLQIGIEKRLDGTGLLVQNHGTEDLRVTVSGLDGLSHEVLNTYDHSVCAGCELAVQIDETCPVIGRLLLARVEVQDLDGLFSEQREIDCGRSNSRIATLSDTSFIVDPQGRTWGWGESRLLGAGPDQDALPRFVETPVEIDRSMLAASGFGRMVSDLRTERHGFALGQSGRLWGWGLGTSGELGNNTHFLLGNSVQQVLPMRLGGALADARMIDYDLSRERAVALDHRGRVWGWGQNRNLENGNTMPSDQPLPVPSQLPILTRTLTSFWQSAEVTTVALSQDGLEVWAWGGRGGWLFPFQGAGTAEACWRGSRVCPPTALDLSALDGVPVRDIVTNEEHTVILDALGRVWSGDNLDSSASAPVMLDLTMLEGVPVIGIATAQPGGLSGVDATFLYDKNGRLWSFGNNRYGILGVGSDVSAIEQPTPVVFPSEAGRITELAIGLRHAFAIDENHCFWGWGSSAIGSPLGRTANLEEPVPVSVLNDHSPICVTPKLRVATPISTAAGGSMPLDIRLSTPYSLDEDLELTLRIVDETVATLSTQTLTIPASETEPAQTALIEGRMPGSTHMIVSADAPEIADVEHIVSVSDPNNQGFSAVTAGALHTCAIRNDGFVSCWGFGANDRTLPPNQVFTGISAGSEHNCGIGLDGAVSCWGRDHRDQATAPPELFTQVAAGGSHSCGLRADQTIACWGSDFNGLATPPEGAFLQVTTGQELNCALAADRNVACWGPDRLVSDLPTGEFQTVSAGNDYACAIRPDSYEVVCWGDSFDGADQPPPVPMRSLSAGSNHACGIDLNGSAICWGSNSHGQSNPPAAAATDLVAIAAGFRHSCALNSSGELICWGSNQYGQIIAP